MVIRKGDLDVSRVESTRLHRYFMGGEKRIAIVCDKLNVGGLSKGVVDL